MSLADKIKLVLNLREQDDAMSMSLFVKFIYWYLLILVGFFFNTADDITYDNKPKYYNKS